MNTPTPRGNVPLTHTERVQRITELIAEGKTNKQIAQDLRVTRSRIDHIVRTRHLREPECAKSDSGHHLWQSVGVNVIECQACGLIIGGTEP